jgi:hypothetical protein
LVSSENPTEEELSRMASGEWTTSRPDLVGEATQNPEKFKQERQKLEELVNSLPADELLTMGWGTCRHIAATASVLYEVLKTRQNGLLMNGSYLLYYSEPEHRYPTVGNHAYNLLVTTSPPAENDSRPDVTISVLDPTSVVAINKLDYTWTRISQIPQFIKKFGPLLGLEKAGRQSLGLADVATKRMEEYLSGRQISESDNNPELANVLNDYVSLVASQSWRENRWSPFEKLVKFLGSRELPPSWTLAYLTSIPVFTDRNKPSTMDEKWIRQFVTEMAKIDHPDNYLLLRTSQILTAKLVDENTGEIVSNPSLNQKNVYLGYLALGAQYMRGCLESANSPDKNNPSPEMIKICTHLIDLGNKTGSSDIPPDLATKFVQTFSKNSSENS